MAELVNLNKALARVKARAEADKNAVKFGRTKAEKDLEKARAEKARATLDAHKRDPE